MNCEVSIKSSLTRPPEVVRAVLANNKLRTQISRRLAKRLGLHSLRAVYVRDNLQILGGPAIALKWRISLQPIVLTFKSLDSNKRKVVYPIVNWNDNDAFWEVIVGQDCEDLNRILMASLQEDHRNLLPSPGPSYTDGADFMGHNVRLCKLDEFITPRNEYFELASLDSDAIKRIAVNIGDSKMIVVYNDSNTVYCYLNVYPTLLKDIQTNESKGQVVARVRSSCPVEILVAFPDSAALINFEN